MIGAQIQLQLAAVGLGCPLEAVQPQPKGHGGSQPGLRVPSAHVRPERRSGYLRSPAADGHMSQPPPRERKGFVRADRCALCEETTSPRTRVLSGGRKPFPSSPPAHQQAHGNNCWSRRGAPPSPHAAPSPPLDAFFFCFFYTYTQDISSGVGVSLSLSSQLHSLSLHCRQGCL